MAVRGKGLKPVLRGVAAGGRGALWWVNKGWDPGVTECLG